MSRSVSSGAETKKFFARIKHQGHPNHTCIDCNRKNAQWASVSYGTFICIECSGTHRSLGVHLSFVRSVTMDSWTKIQLQTMEAGGNARFRAFLEANQFPEGISVANKYNSTAAKAYREWLKAEVRGEDPPEIPFMGYKNDSGFGRSSGGGNYTSASSSSSSSSSSSKSFRGNKKGNSKASGNTSSSSFASQQRQDDDTMRNIVKQNQMGNSKLGQKSSYEGFGSAPMAGQEDDGFWGSMSSSFFSGLETAKSGLETAASTVAHKARQAKEQLEKEEFFNNMKKSAAEGLEAVTQAVQGGSRSRGPSMDVSLASGLEASSLQKTGKYQGIGGGRQASGNTPQANAEEDFFASFGGDGGKMPQTKASRSVSSEPVRAPKTKIQRTTSLTQKQKTKSNKQQREADRKQREDLEARRAVPEPVNSSTPIPVAEEGEMERGLDMSSINAAAAENVNATANSTAAPKDGWNDSFFDDF